MKNNLKPRFLSLASVLFGVAPLASATPESEVPTLNNGPLEGLGTPGNPPAQCADMAIGQWFGEGVNGAAELGDITPPEGAEFAIFDNPGAEGEYSTLSQRFEIPNELQLSADRDLVTLLASFQVNLPPNTYAKGLVTFCGLDGDGNEVQNEEVASFRPDHNPETWETINLRDFQGLDLDAEVTSVVLKIEFTADYPDDAEDVIALVDDVRVFAHTVTEDVEVDTSDLASDNVVYITGTPEANFVWALYDEVASEMKIFRGPILVDTIDTTDLKRLQVYMGRRTDAFFIVDQVGARFANKGIAEVYLHSGSDLCAASISLNPEDFEDLEGIIEKMEELQGLLTALEGAFKTLASDEVEGLLAERVGPGSVSVMEQGYSRQLAFKEDWEAGHQIQIETKITEVTLDLQHLEQLLNAHDTQMEIILADEENSEYDSQLEALEEQWESAIDALEDEWEEAELAVSDENENDEYDEAYPIEGTTVTPLDVQNYIAELEDRLENIDDAIDKDEEAYEDVRDEQIEKLEEEFLAALDARLTSIQTKLDCVQAIADVAGEETSGEVVTAFAPFEAEAEAEVLALESDVQVKLQEIFARVGQVSHDNSAGNNFGRASLRGADDDGPADVESDKNPDELGEEVFGVIDDISDLINDWLLPDDPATNPTPIDCSEGQPSIDNMSGLVFGMAGVDIVIGTIQNDLLSGGNGPVDLIIGLAGNDVLRGAQGIDIMLGMGGDDFLHGGDDLDLLLGDAMPLQAIFPGLTPGNDCLEGEDGIDFLFGEPGDDHLDGGFDYDLLVGGADNDRLFGDAHNDLMIGWKGNDILLSDAEDNQKWSNVMLGDSLFPLVDAGEDELYATLGNEVSANLAGCNMTWVFGDLMLGGEEDDLLEGADGIDVQFGNRGEDIINGREQIDIQFGGRDNDVIRGHRGGVALEINVKGICVPIRIGNIMFGNQGDDEMHGGADMDIMFGNRENDEIRGNDGSFHLLSLENIPLFGDFIFAGSGEDWVDGMAGSDKIFGGTEDDILYGDDGALFFGFSINPLNDIIFGNSGDDTIYGGLAPDFLFGNSGDDTIYNGRGLFDFAFGNRGEDEIYGERGVDFIFGNRENDQLHGGRGAFDLIFGNRGDDKIRGDRGIDFLFGNDGNDLIWGGSSIDIIRGDGIIPGQTGNDEMWGELGLDIIFGNSGDDIGHGGPFMDIMFGNRGNDCFEGNEGNDLIFGNAGSDQLRGQDGRDRIFGDGFNGNSVFLTLGLLNIDPGEDIIWGGNKNDRLKGGGERDIIYGEEGNDKIRGDGGINIGGTYGDDLLFGGPGRDKIKGNRGNDHIYGGLDNDRLKGGRDEDLIYGGSGNDKIKGDAIFMSGNDELYGGCGDDKIKGGLGNDIVFGGPGRDKIKGKAGFDQLVGNEGDDKIKGGLHADRIFGDDGADKIKGGWGDDIILGGAGDDVKLKGGLGEDRIHGGTGADKIKGNLGRDTLDTGNDSVRDKVFGGWARDTIYADKGEDRIRRRRELVSNSSDNDSGIQNTTRPTPRQGERFVYGCKWEDSNGDGIRQPNEPAVIGWEIYADLNSNMRRDPGEPWTTTQADDPSTWPNEEGCYCLSIPLGVSGSFTIQEQLNPDIYEPSFPNSTGTYAIGSSTCLDGGEIYTGLDFGNVPVPTDKWIKVSGRKWYDINRDGRFQDEEIAYNGFIVGTLIWADLDGDGVLSPGEPHARVGKDGTYCLRVPAGQRIFICEDPSSNDAGIEMVHTFPTGDRPCHVISGADGDLTCDFGNKRKEKIDTIDGVVWNDLNSDGDYSKDEPLLEGGRVVLDENHNGRADQGEPFGQITREGRFVIQIPNDCLPPDTGFNVIYDCQSDNHMGRTKVSRAGDFSTEGAGGSRAVFFGVGEDCDCDGLADTLEQRLGTSPKLVDSDADNLSDYAEHIVFGTSPADSDSDNDGLNDGDEIQIGTDPHCADCDGDGIPDGSETGGFDPLDPDSNDDGIWDGIALELGLRPGELDRDRDGASDFVERFVFNTNPDRRDTDGDGFDDLLEGAAGFSPLSKNDNPNFGLNVEPGGRVSRFEVSQLEDVGFEAVLEVGHAYRIEKTSDLMSWEMVREFEATQRVNAFELPRTGGRCYYRVRRVE